MQKSFSKETEKSLISQSSCYIKLIPWIQYQNILHYINFCHSHGLYFALLGRRRKQKGIPSILHVLATQWPLRISYRTPSSFINPLLATLDYVDVNGIYWRGLGNLTDAGCTVWNVSLGLVPSSILQVYWVAHRSCWWNVLSGGWGTCLVQVVTVWNVSLGLVPSSIL